jgi:hypothetical protein
MITIILATIVSVTPHDIRLKADTMTKGIVGLYAPEYSLAEALESLHGEDVIVRFGVYDKPVDAVKAIDDDDIQKIGGKLQCRASKLDMNVAVWDDKSVKIQDVDVSELLRHHVGKTLYFGVHR